MTGSRARGLQLVTVMAKQPSLRARWRPQPVPSLHVVHESAKKGPAIGPSGPLPGHNDHRVQVGVICEVDGSGATRVDSAAGVSASAGLRCRSTTTETGSERRTWFSSAARSARVDVRRPPASSTGDLCPPRADEQAAYAADASQSRGPDRVHGFLMPSQRGRTRSRGPRRTDRGSRHVWRGTPTNHAEAEGTPP